MKNIENLFAIAFIIIAVGCSSQGAGRNGSIQAQNQKLLEDNEKRLEVIEKSLNSLNTQIAQLNNRVYEVRNKNGQKTSMTVVPITPITPPSPNTTQTVKVKEPLMQPGQTAENALQASRTAAKSEPGAAINEGIQTQAQASTQQNPTAQSAAASPARIQKPAPAGRKIDPAAKPTPLRASQPVQTASKTAGASGRIGQSPRPGAEPVPANYSELALPPTDLITTESSAASDSTTPGAPASDAVPVPNIFAGELALPPETDITNIAVPRAQTAAQPAKARAQPPARGEEAAYNTALRAARSGHLNEAINLFRQFQQQYPNGRYKANADYWIGECLYSQGKLQDALAQFQNVNSVYPTHHKNADALLKAGMTLSRLGNQPAAQEKYRTLINSFPNSDAAKRARAMGIK